MAKQYSIETTNNSYQKVYLCDHEHLEEVLSEPWELIASYKRAEVNTTQFTNLNSEEVRTIVSRYTIGGLISSKVLSGGSENTNYEIVTDEGKFVLTICEQKSKKEADNLALLLEYLAGQDYRTSRPCKTKENSLVGTYEGKPIFVKSFLEGKIMADLPNHLLTLIGRQMGKLHKIDAPDYLPKTIRNYGKENFHEVKLYDPGSPFHLWLQKMEAYIEPFFSLNLPKSLIHSDVFFSNVIVSDAEDSVVIMDFEEATYFYRVYDIGMAIIGLCAAGPTIDLTKVNALVKGYLKEVDLTDSEKRSLQPFTVFAAASMCFWRHKNFNYTVPTPKLKNHYLELKRLADFVKDLPADCFEELIF